MGNTCRCCTSKVKNKKKQTSSPPPSEICVDKRKESDSISKQLEPDRKTFEQNGQTNVPNNNSSENGDKKFENKELDLPDVQVKMDNKQTSESLKYMDVLDMATQMTTHAQECNADISLCGSDSSKTVSIASCENFDYDDFHESVPNEIQELQMKFITKGLQIPVYVQTPGEDQLNQAAVLECYSSKKAGVVKWLDLHEETAKNVCDLPVPLEPNALQEQIKMVEELVAKISHGDGMLQDVNSALNSLLLCPAHVYQHLTEDGSNLHQVQDGLRQRYTALVNKTENLCSKLFSTLQQAEVVRNQFESLQKLLQDISYQTAASKKDCWASSEVVEHNISDMAEATKKLEQASHMMENVQNLCVQLFATGTSEAGYSLKNTLANLVTLHAKVKHEAEHWCSHLADTHNKLAMFESYEKEITNFLDETNVQATELIKHSSGEEKDLEKVQQLLHNLLDKLKGIKLLQSSLLEKEPKYLETVSCGEMLLVNCCFDTTVIAAKLESLKEKWKTTLHDFSDCECKVEQHKNQLDKKQQALSKLKDWIVSCHVYMYDMNSTMESDVVTSDINALEQFLEEGNNIQVDPTFEPFLLSEFSLPVPQQTGEEPKKTSFHKTKEKVSERKINLTELVLDIKQLFDMFNTFRSLLDMLMTQLSEWENQMNPPIEKLRETLEAYKKWKDKVSSCTTEYSDLQSTTAALQRKHAERINFDSVKDEFNVLNARWNDLLQSSSKCLQDLLKKCNAYEQYCDKHQRSVEWLQDKRTIFSMLNVSCTELSVYSKQHAQIEALLDDVVNRESHLEECSQFVEILPQLKEKFDLIWTDWNSLKEDLVALSFQQSESLKQIKALFIVLEELQSWSETVCSKIAQTEIQCNRIWLKYENETFSSHESFNFGEGEKKYTEVFETADNLLKSNVLSNSLHSDIMTKANFANNSASQAYDNYGEIVSKTKTTFEEIALSCKSIKDALKIVSSQLSSFGHVPVVRKDIEAKLQQLQDLQKDVDNNKILQKKIENMFEQVRKFCRCEKHPNLITETENIFNVVQGDINQLKENLLSQTNGVLKFEEMAKDIENRLNGIEKHIKLTKEMSGLTAKQIKFAKDIHIDLCDEASNVLALCDFAKRLSGDTQDGTCESVLHIAACDGGLIERANGVAEKFQDLKIKNAELQANLEHVLKFEKEISEAAEDLQSAENLVDNLDPISRNKEQMAAQKESSLSVLKNVTALKHTIQDLDDRYMSYSDSDFGVSNHERDIKALLRNVNRLVANAEKRKNDVEDVSRKLQGFFKEAQFIEDNLNAMIHEMKQKDSSSGNLADLLEMQKDLKVFRKNSLVPARKQTNAVNSMGYELIYSAHQSVRTNHITDRLKAIDIVWQQLNQLVGNYDSSVQRSMIKCGQFQDVYQSYITWLKNVELMIAQQQAPSWEYSVVAVQLEEHKALQEILQNEQVVLLSLIGQFQDVESNLSEQDNKNLEMLKLRWDGVWKKITERSEKLTEIVLEARIFNGLTNRFKKWLQKVEKQASDIVFSGNLHDRIEKEISHQQALARDINHHETEICEIEGTPLKEMLCDNDINLQSLENFIENLRNKYSEISSFVTGRKNTLENNKKLSHLFNDRLLNLFAFVSESNMHLSKWEDEKGNVHVLDAKPMFIKHAIESCQIVLVDVSSKNSMLSKAITEGRELLSKCAGDDNLIAHAKLDSLSVEFNSIIARAKRIIEKLDGMYEVSTEMQEKHQLFIDWLKTSNEKFLDMETGDVTSIDELKNTLKEFDPNLHKPTLNFIKIASEKLSLISVWWGTQLLNKLHMHCETQFITVNKRFALHCDCLEALTNEIKEFNDHLDVCQLQLGNVNECINNVESLSSFKQDNLFSKQDTEQKMKDLISEVGCQSVKLEQDLHKLRCKLATSDFNIINAQMEGYREQLKDTMEKYSFCTKHASLAISLGCKWHQSSSVLTAWMIDAKSSLKLIQEEKFAQMETHKQKLQSLFNRHADMGLHVASMTKCTKEIEKLLGNNTAVQEIILNSEQKKLEYENLSEMLSNIIDSTNNTCSLMKTIQQQIETSFTSLSSMMDNLHQLAPISIDKESILRRKQKFELSQTADCMLEVSVIEENVNQLFALLSNIGYDHLKEGILVKFNSLQDLKTDLASLIALELNKLEKLLSNLQQFSNFLENTNQKIDDLYQNVTDITVQQVVNPDVMSQQTHKFEALTEEILVVVDQHNKLQMLGDECKSIQLLSGHETSFIDRETEEVSMKLQKLQAVFDKVKFKFNEALEYAIHFYKTSTELKQFFLNQCGTIDKLIPANDLEMIKNQMEILKDIRASSAPHQVEAKKLCTHAFELMSHTTADIDIQNEDVLKLQNASSLLDEKLLQAQVALDKALIEVGELKHAIEEMLQWQEQIFGELTSQKQRLDPCSHDSKKLDHELTKLELMRQDVIAHHSSYNSIISKFGNIMNSSIEGESTDALSDDVEELKQTWQNINLLIAELQQALDKSLESAQMKEAELLEIDFWIDETLANLSGTNFFGGLPESAQQQLDTHMELMKELQNKKNALENLVMDENREVDDIVKKMNHLSSVAEVREEKLKEALEEAKAFHKRLQNFTSWLGKAEKTLEVFLETNHTWLFPDLIEIDTEQKKFEAEVTGMRPEILALDKTGSHLKYFSQKQDGILIKNLLLSVHSRWDKLLSGTSSRSISLSDIHKKSKQFHDNYDKLLDWMQQAIKQLGENKSNLYVDAPDLVETELQKFKEFQRALSEKQPVYDGVTRAGVILSEKVTLQSDLQTIESKLKHLKQEWNALNETSVQRKNQLEESLLFSGRFTEAIDSLLQWLCKIEPEVNTQAQLQGDIHTVTALLDRHNILYNEFNARHANVDSLQQSVSRGQGDSWVTHQLQELLERWNTVSDKIALKQECLEDALCKAKKLHSSGQLLLEDLSAVEKYLNSQQRFPADEFQLQELKASFHTLSQELLNKENDKNHVISLATAILEEAHPDAHTPIRQLMTVVQTKWEEIKQKSDDYGLNLNKTIAKLKQDTIKMKNLESWLTSAEETLSAKESLHITAENVERLKQELDAFQEDMLAHQSDYEMLMNLYSKRKSGQPKRKEGIKSPRDYDESPMESMFANTHSLWQKVWLKALDHERKLQEAKEAIRRSNQQHEFDFDNWRKRYMKWMKHKRARVMDFFRELDKDGSGQITRQQFIQEILNSKFHTDEAEMTKVADVFDKDGDGYIDYYEFIAALYPSRDTYKTESDADKIDDEVIRQVAKCTCCKKFKVEQIAENKYKFGDNQQLRLVRILRSTVMVRVGGGWMALDEFLIKNDPCRAKGRTNTELREKFILPSGASQAMTPFKTKRSSRSPQKQAHPSPSSSTQNLATTSTTPSKQTSPASAGTSHVKAQRETPKRTSKIPTKDKTPKR